MASLVRRAVAECIGTPLLVIAVVGSGIAAQTLSPTDTDLELLDHGRLDAGDAGDVVEEVDQITRDAAAARCSRSRRCDPRSCRRTGQTGPIALTIDPRDTLLGEAE